MYATENLSWIDPNSLTVKYRYVVFDPSYADYPPRVDMEGGWVAKDKRIAIQEHIVSLKEDIGWQVTCEACAYQTQPTLYLYM